MLTTAIRLGHAETRGEASAMARPAAIRMAKLLARKARAKRFFFMQCLVVCGGSCMRVVTEEARSRRSLFLAFVAGGVCYGFMCGSGAVPFRCVREKAPLAAREAP